MLNADTRTKYVKHLMMYHTALVEHGYTQWTDCSSPKQFLTELEMEIREMTDYELIEDHESMFDGQKDTFMIERRIKKDFS